MSPSGSGKSSLLRAGLLPRLEHLKERWVVVPPVLPGQQPTRNLARSLSRAFAARGHERPTDELEDRVSEGRMLSYQEALAQYHLHPEPKFHIGGYLDRGVTRRRHIVEGGRQKSRGNLAEHSGPQTKGGAAPMARNPITPIT
jgi:Novel STAND NTPase 1